MLDDLSATSNSKKNASETSSPDPDKNCPHITAVKAAIAKGHYAVDSHRVADKILRTAKMLVRQIHDVEHNA